MEIWLLGSGAPRPRIRYYYPSSGLQCYLKIIESMAEYNELRPIDGGGDDVEADDNVDDQIPAGVINLRLFNNIGGYISMWFIKYRSNLNIPISLNPRVC